MKQRAVTKTTSRRNSMTARRRRSTLPAVSRKTAGKSSTRASSTKTSSRTSRSAKSTTNHDEIREWVESRGGHPATVKRTRKGGQAAGVLRIDFPGFSGQTTLQAISWDDWFKVFDQRKLAFLYENRDDSRFSKLVSRTKSRATRAPARR